MNAHETIKKESATASESGLVTPALCSRRPNREAGKVRPLVLLWALGVPLPIIAIIFLVRGCQ